MWIARTIRTPIGKFECSKRSLNSSEIGRSENWRKKKTGDEALIFRQELHCDPRIQRFKTFFIIIRVINVHPRASYLAAKIMKRACFRIRARGDHELRTDTFNSVHPSLFIKYRYKRGDINVPGSQIEKAAMI